MVYDITAPSSLEALDYFDSLIEMESEERMHREGLDAVPHIKIVAGNKCDLAAERKVSSAAGLEWARKHGAGFMETSARNVVNIEETFECELFPPREEGGGGGGGGADVYGRGSDCEKSC